MELKDKEFFHIHRISPDDQWTEGKRISFLTGEKNYFNKFYDEIPLSTNIFGEQNELLIGSIKKYNALIKKEIFN